MDTWARNESRLAGKPVISSAKQMQIFSREFGVISVVLFHNNITEFPRFPAFPQVAHLNLGHHNYPQYFIILKSVHIS
jgi:hypothetical protein